MHTFSFCNALHRVLARGETGSELVRGLFHGAMSIYVDRFLDIPGAQLPSEQPLENLPTAADSFAPNPLDVSPCLIFDRGPHLRMGRFKTRKLIGAIQVPKLESPEAAVELPGKFE
jgi:hypothetical protein